MSEQKRLDRPDREKIKDILYDEDNYEHGLDGSRTGHIKFRKVLEKLSALILDIEEADQRGYFRGVDWATKIGEKTLNKIYKAYEQELEEAKKQERKDIGLELQLATSRVVNKPNFNQYRLSEFITIAAHKLIDGQALKEEK